MQSLLYIVLGWFAAKIVTSIFIRLFSYFTVAYFATTAVHTIIDTIYGYLNEFPGLQVLLLAGVGDAISIIGSAILFRVTFIPHVYKPNITGSGT